MATFLLKSSWIIILILISCIQYSDGFLFSFLNASYKPFACKTHTVYGSNYNDSFIDLLIATFFTSNGDFVSTNIQYVLDVSKALDETPSIPGININYIFYLYPRSECNNNTFDLFLDVILNQKLLEGKPFKLIAILAHQNNTELRDLSNIVSPFSIPIFVLTPGRRFYIQKIKKQYDFYDNVIYVPHENIPKIDFLVNLTRKFNVRMISLFHDYDDTNEIDILTSDLQEKLICVNVYHMKAGIFDNQEKLNLVIEKDNSNIFVFISETHVFLLNLMQVLNNSTGRKRILIIYNYYYPMTTVIDKNLNSIKEINFPLYAVKTLTNRTKRESNFLLFYTIALVVGLQKSIERKISSISKILQNQLFSRITEAKATRNLDPNLSVLLVSQFSHWLTLPDNLHVEVEYITKINVSVNHSSIYYHEINYDKPKVSHWKCTKCDHFSDLQPICTKRTCLAGYYPVYLSQGCCWKCQLCLPGFVKPYQGQHECIRCSSESLTNQNRTNCVPFKYIYFQINELQMIVAIIMSFLGCIYTVTYLVIFIWFRNTPMVKSSNIKLSAFQMLLHLSLNIHITITFLKQEKVVCFIHCITGFLILKLIMSVYIIKTNQLLTIFKADIKIDRSICLTMKEIFFPVIYFAVNIFVVMIVSVVYKGEEYGLMETKNAVEKYNYCKMTVYFLADLVLVLVLSVICTIQSFLARRLPTNFNETYYIFLAMFTTTILLLLSIPLHASYNKDGRQMFVNSCIIYSANISLITFAYGYKICIILFRKHLNTREAFNNNRLKAFKKKVEEQTTETASEGVL